MSSSTKVSALADAIVMDEVCAQGGGSDALKGASGEFRFVAACLRWPHSAENLEEIAELGLQGQDWDRVLRIARRHRVVGLVYRGSQAARVVMPGDAANELRAEASAQTRQTMSFALEAGRLQRLFADAGIGVLFLKGVALTMLAYGDLSLRQAKDVDLLIAPEDEASAGELLRGAGYRPRFTREAMTQAQFELWRKHSKGMEWFHAGKAIELELHWKLTDMPRLLQDLSATDQRQMVAIPGGRALTTLDSEHLFAFLCVHGAAHAWSRLKWLADIHALLPARAEEVEHMYRRAAELGARRAAGQALLLCRDLLGLRLAPGLRKELERDWILWLLKKAALTTILRGGSEREIYEMEFGTSLVYLSRFLLADGGRFLVEESLQRAYPPDLVAMSRLPRRLIFVFPAVRLFGWVVDRVRHVSGARAG